MFGFAETGARKVLLAKLNLYKSLYSNTLHIICSVMLLQSLFNCVNGKYQNTESFYEA